MTPDSIHNPFSNTYASPQITIILTILLVLFLLLGFFTVYFSRCFLHTLSQTFNIRRIRSGLSLVHPPSASSPSSRGLATLTVLSFPVITISSVPEISSLDCPICLSEFKDDDLLRLLTLCRHVFHRDCVDLWFISHKTCPVCRRTLDVVSPEKTPPVSMVEPEEQQRVVRIEMGDVGRGEVVRSGGGRPERFSRSNSTGHSMEVYEWVKVTGGGDGCGGSDRAEVSVRRGSGGGDVRSVGGDLDIV